MPIAQKVQLGKDEWKKGERSGVKTLQAAEPSYSVSNGPVKTNVEIIGKWKRIYKIGLRISILLIVLRKDRG